MTRLKYKEYKTDLVKIDNSIIRSPKKFSLIEEKIFFSLLKNIDVYKEEVIKKEYPVISFNIKEIYKDFNLATNTEFTNQSVIKKIFTDENHEFIGKTSISVEDDSNIRVAPLFTDIYLDKKTNMISLTINSVWKNELLKLHSHFTIVELQKIISFSGKYTLKLYSYFRSWLLTEGNLPSERFETVDSLKEYLGIDKEEYVRYKTTENRKNKTNPLFNRDAFEKYVLNPAIEELLEKANIVVQYEFEKKSTFGKRYIFTFKDVSSQIRKKEAKSKADTDAQAQGYKNHEELMEVANTPWVVEKDG